MKKNKQAIIQFLRSHFYLILTLLAISAQGQQTSLSDYMFFSGNGGPGVIPAPGDGYGVFIASTSTISSGYIGSLSLVKTTAASSIASNIFSGGKVVLANGTNVSGRITAANTQAQSGTIFSAGTGVNLSGNIDVNGNTVVGGGIVSGNVKHPSGTSYTGPAPASNTIGTPSLPILPSLPAITSFPAAGASNITNTQTLSPGSYGNMTLSGAKTITLNGPGVYVFNSIMLTNSNNFVFNFQNTSNGDFKIYVHGNANLALINSSFMNGGSASRIFLESHGTGGGGMAQKSSVAILNSPNASSGTVIFQGTIWAPYANVYIGYGSGTCQFKGAAYSGSQVIVNLGASLTFSPMLNCSAFANAGGPNVSPCVGNTVTLGNAGVSGVTYSWSPSSNLSNANIANPTFTAVTPGSTNYILTINTGSCSIIDTVVVQVNALPNVSAGNDDTMYCSTPSIQLNGSSTTANAQFNWSTTDGLLSAGSNTSSPTVTLFGTFVLTVTNPANGCSAKDTAVVYFVSCILPGYEPPPNGKDTNVIGSDLESLFEHFNGTTNPNEDIFVMQNDSIWVEIIYNNGQYSTLMSYLTAPPFSASNFVDNGTGNRIITTLIRVAELDDLNHLNLTTNQNIINYVRPLYRPIASVGVAYTLGDIGQRSNISRDGFKASGEGIKVGVISDSYNSQPGNHASIDVSNCDLPGINSICEIDSPVHVLLDYTSKVQSDEGRAMLQIVHDIAPKADLAFRTGFISAGNMAKGIHELQQAGCNIITDDISYLTEPYFKDGMIATAVNEVKDLGVTYVVAAGNFGDKSYEGVYSPMTAPNNISGTAHNFGGGDIFQSISLTPGNYLVALQWEDDFYSINQAASGTQNDLDIYLSYNNGKTLFGFNRNNIGGDPLEVLPFKVTENTNTNILITRTAGNGSNVHFKYIFFRGTPTINEHIQGTSTIVGQANALGAITTGAVLYRYTPSFTDTLTKASFSSVGGTITNGVVRSKPDLCAPNGGNTTVDFGSPDIEGDLLPNFFGTSASAPHAAGVAALLMETKLKFYGSIPDPDEVKNTLTSNTIDMYTSGFDLLSGYGLLDAYAALKSIANPTPKISSLEIPEDFLPGSQPFSLFVHGRYLTPESKVLFRSDTLVTSYLNDSTLTTIIPAFDGNPPIRVYTPPITSSQLDGGPSDSVYLFSYPKLNVVVTANNKSKKYGESLPVFDATITVDGIPIEQSNYSLSELGLDSISYITPATPLSNVANYVIVPTAQVNNPELQELYNYTFNQGILSIVKMPLLITPNNLTVSYGDPINGKDISFDYSYDNSNIPVTLEASILDSIRIPYESALLEQVALIDDRDDYYESTLSLSDLNNLSLMSGSKAIANGSRAVANGSRAVANNFSNLDTTFVIDLSYRLLYEYNDDGSSPNLNAEYLLMNGSKAIANGSKAIVNSSSLVNGTALVNGSKAIANGSRAVANGSKAIANSGILGSGSNSNAAVIIHEQDTVSANSNPDSSFALYPINGITGLTAGTHYIIPGTFLNANFEVTYSPGELEILPYELTIDVRDTTTQYGTVPVFPVSYIGLQYDDSIEDIIGNQLHFSPYEYTEFNVGIHSIEPYGIEFLNSDNYTLNMVTGNLTVTPAPLSLVADSQEKSFGMPNPPLTISYSGFKYYDNETNAFTTQPTIQTNATLLSPEGNYPIQISGGIAPNYSITAVDGNLSIYPSSSNCMISPTNLPGCYASGNTLYADNVWQGYDYVWNIPTSGWQINGSITDTFIHYTSGAPGFAEFSYTVYIHNTDSAVFACHKKIDNICYPQYCAYDQSFWSDNSQTDCGGNPSLYLLDSLLHNPLLIGDLSRSISIDTNEASCLSSKLPASYSFGLLPLGHTNCTNATSTDYLTIQNTGKFKNELLGNTIALALSIRNNPALADLKITGNLLITYASTSCPSGSIIPNSENYFFVPESVYFYLNLDTNNKVSDLLQLANKALSGTSPTNQVSQFDLSYAISSILDGFTDCRIFSEFIYENSARTINSDTAASIDDKKEQLFSLYPNPTSDKTRLSFKTSKGENISIKMYDVNGRLTTTLYNQQAEKDGSFTLESDLSAYNNGIYFVHFVQGNKTSIKKLIIMGH